MDEEKKEVVSVVSVTPIQFSFQKVEPNNKRMSDGRIKPQMSKLEVCCDLGPLSNPNSPWVPLQRNKWESGKLWNQWRSKMKDLHIKGCTRLEGFFTLQAHSIATKITPSKRKPQTLESFMNKKMMWRSRPLIAKSFHYHRQNMKAVIPKKQRR